MRTIDYNYSDLLDHEIQEHQAQELRAQALEKKQLLQLRMKQNSFRFVAGML